MTTCIGLITVVAAALNVLFAALAFGGVWVELDDGTELSLVGDNDLGLDWVDSAMTSSAVALSFAAISGGLTFLACCCLNKIYVLVTILNCGVVGAAMGAVGIVVVHVRDREFLDEYFGVAYSWGFAFQIITAAFGAWLICLALITRASEDLDKESDDARNARAEAQPNGYTEAPATDTDTMAKA